MQGNVDAQLMLAYFYETDEVVPKDISMTYTWMLVAAASGSKQAQSEMLGYKIMLEPADVERAEAAAEQIQAKLTQ